MPFKDTNTGSTHYVGDGCNPPHIPLVEKTNDMATLTDIYERSGLMGIQKFINQQKEEIYIDLMKIADDGELEEMRREIIRYFSKK